MTEQKYTFMQTRTLFLRQMESIKRHYPGAVQMDTLRINYYYDTPDEALQKDNIILCVRQKEQQLVGERNGTMYAVMMQRGR